MYCYQWQKGVLCPGATLHVHKSAQTGTDGLRGIQSASSFKLKDSLTNFCSVVGLFFLSNTIYSFLCVALVCHAGLCMAPM